VIDNQYMYMYMLNYQQWSVKLQMLWVLQLILYVLKDLNINTLIMIISIIEINYKQLDRVIENIVGTPSMTWMIHILSPGHGNPISYPDMDIRYHTCAGISDIIPGHGYPISHPGTDTSHPDRLGSWEVECISIKHHNSFQKS
jgi:hypothetical protein